jgi:N-acetylneuraminate synthase
VGHAPFIIAEMSGNHNQSLDRALALVDAAAAAGADAVKIQTYTADTMTLDVDKPGFIISDSKSLWHGKSLYQLYEEAHTPWEWHKPIFDRCRERGLIGFSSPFDETAVDFLESLDMPCYKIASFEIIDLPLIERVAATGKPMIMSTGMASVDEITEAVQVAREGGCRDIALLHCVSGYPTPAEEANLTRIPDIAQRFGAVVGLSDHTRGTAVAVASVALGAALIEKHFTLRRADGGPDAAFSLEPEELHALCEESCTAWRALGTPGYQRKPSEEGNVAFRRSLYVVEDVAPGEVFTSRNVRSIRPGYGLPPKHLRAILGQSATQAIARGTPLDWPLVNDKGVDGNAQ